MPYSPGPSPNKECVLQLAVIKLTPDGDVNPRLAHENGQLKEQA